MILSESSKFEGRSIWIDGFALEFERQYPCTVVLRELIWIFFVT